MLTPSNYASLYRSCQLTTDQKKLAELNFICATAIASQDQYRAVQNGTYDNYGVAVPWPLIAAIHFRESNQRFDRHLHNGDPLTARTTHVPKGRPFEGKPPFTWAESAIDAFDNTWVPVKWDLPGCLEFLERYNGTGYQKHGVASPYVWNYTDRYLCGLYVADGTFDPVKIDARPGAVAILKVLSQKGVSLDFTGVGAVSSTVH